MQEQVKEERSGKDKPDMETGRGREEEMWNLRREIGIERFIFYFMIESLFYERKGKEKVRDRAIIKYIHIYKQRDR